ncbi:unnamed protein product [Ranitomeya imitator]|uniref:Uncharacterized protein n=1 Tax=Ranitomeya imitator TaxID=111125 RepID=A0ABN9LFQ1_9NEOB|nr:unnamed protein product [Ranitomeya imitator]
MSSSERLDELRSLNKCLLEKLNVNREELKKQQKLFTARNVTSGEYNEWPDLGAVGIQSADLARFHPPLPGKRL